MENLQKGATSSNIQTHGYNLFQEYTSLFNANKEKNTEKAAATKKRKADDDKENDRQGLNATALQFATPTTTTPTTTTPTTLEEKAALMATASSTILSTNSNIHPTHIHGAGSEFSPLLLDVASPSLRHVKPNSGCYTTGVTFPSNLDSGVGKLAPRPSNNNVTTNVAFAASVSSAKGRAKPVKGMSTIRRCWMVWTVGMRQCLLH